LEFEPIKSDKYQSALKSGQVILTQMYKKCLPDSPGQIAILLKHKKSTKYFKVKWAINKESKILYSQKTYEEICKGDQPDLKLSQNSFFISNIGYIFMFNKV